MGVWSRWWASPPPGVGLEIGTSHVTAVSLRRGGRVTLTAHAEEALPAGAVVPSLVADNIVDRTAVTQAVRRALERVGSPKRVALAIPDTAAKVSMVRFEKVPPRLQDLEQMVRWQVRKAVPFPIEAAQVGFAAATAVEGGGREYLVVVVRRDVVESYEALVHAAGAHAGLVDLASFNVVNLVLSADAQAGAAQEGDWLLIHLTPQASTLVIVRDGQLVFYRSRGVEGQEPLVDLVHQTAMYNEDRLGGRGFARVLLSAGSEALRLEPPDLKATLEDRLRRRVELVDPRNAVTLADRISASDDHLVSMSAAVGAVVREVA